MLKIVSCIAVIGLHTFQKDISILNSTLYYLCGFAVPAFFASSGAFLMNRSSVSWQYVIKKICLILRVVIIWNVLIVGAQLALKIVFHTEFEFDVLTVPEEIVKSLLQKGSMWQFWYFGALIILYLFLPFMHKLKQKNRLVLVVILGVIAIGLQICSIFNGAPVQKNIIQTFRLWTWLFYFIGGGLVYNYITSEKHNFSRYPVLLTIVTIALLVYQNCMGRFVIMEKSGVLYAEYFYDSVLTMVWVFLLFCTVKTVILRGKQKNLVGKIAPLTMGIYIIHPLIIRVCNHFFKFDTIFGSIVLFMVVLFSSVIVAWVISKIPGIRHLIKL